jgi:hypothetical protein
MIPQSEYVFLIAGGPSTEEHAAALRQLKHCGYFMGVNDSFLHVPCDAIVSMDGRWMHERREDWLKTDIPKHLSWKHYKKWLKDDPRETLPKDNIFLYDVDTKKTGMSVNTTTLFAKHSGAMALNLAFLMKPKAVFLFGMDHTAHRFGQTIKEHWYGDYPWRPKRDLFYHMKEWLPDHDVAAKQFTEAEIGVYNISRISIVESYKKWSMQDVLNHFGILQAS